MIDLANYPALAPPQGVESNFDHPHSLGSTIIILNAIFLGLMLIVVTTRIYARWFLVGKLGYDDYTCVLAAIGSILHTSYMIRNLSHGYGKHLWDIRAITLDKQALRDLNTMAIIYPFLILLVKLTISLLYLRLFSVHKTFRQLVYGQATMCVVFYIALAIWQIYVIVNCTSPTQLSGSKICGATSKVNLACACFNVVTDFVLLALPVHIVMRLKLATSKKVGLLVIFGAGSVATIVSVVRLIFIAKELSNHDILYNAAYTSAYTIIEINVGIIAASMSSLPLAFTKTKTFLNSTFGSFRSTLLSNRTRSTRSKSAYASDYQKESSKQVTSDEFIPLQG